MEISKQDIEIIFRDNNNVFFENIQGYQLGSGFLGVLDQQGIMNIYPSDSILVATITPKE